MFHAFLVACALTGALYGAVLAAGIACLLGYTCMFCAWHAIKWGDKYLAPSIINDTVKTWTAITSG